MFNLFSEMRKVGVKPGSRVKLGTGEVNAKGKPVVKQVVSSDLPLPKTAKELNRYVADDATKIPASFSRTVAKNENGQADELFRPDSAQIASVILASKVLGIAGKASEGESKASEGESKASEREAILTDALNGQTA